jgi:hypothetical protein
MHSLAILPIEEKDVLFGSGLCTTDAYTVSCQTNLAISIPFRDAVRRQSVSFGQSMLALLRQELRSRK